MRRCWRSSPRLTAISLSRSCTTATGRSRTAWPTACCATRSCGGRRAGSLHHRVADSGHLHPRTGQAAHVAAHAGAPAKPDLVRREQRRRMPAGAEEPAPATPAAEDEATLRDRRRVVQAALTQLPADQRQALELAYYGGLTQTELAAARRPARHCQEPNVRGLAPARRPAPRSGTRARARAVGPPRRNRIDA